ncbi:hypothetical protein ACFWXK_14110 [Streptomyces sp. NPDC059070]
MTAVYALLFLALCMAASLGLLAAAEIRHEKHTRRQADAVDGRPRRAAHH